ncbi:hypothetical protein PF011_g30070 [Phytophthora fragariae]|uniref:ZSWIM1/3 RNaseH-like domain-containing protein n=1 Tax=Phytophthora fragariae TaxID=53985 RepID=A0A6A3GU30_9STRA|nr:hypothetical protein PF011_g30070 [Phytophthora fragariae]
MRKSHNLRRMEFPFQMLAQVTQMEDGWWGLVVKREVYSHNHQVSPRIYQHYPGIRQVSQQSPLVSGVQLLMQAQAGASSIYEYTRESSDHHVTMKDVHNLVARLRSSGAQLSDDDAVAETIVNFNLESSMNVSSVHQSARGNTGVISITSGHMRSIVDSFPEVLQMDCTHKTNKYNYQLLAMVAMDQFGHGQPVQYSLLETNADWHMAKCLDHFKRANEHWRFVRIVIVDKDMHEVEVVRQKLPEARVLYCHFHVIMWLHETIRKSTKYGAYPADVLIQMKHTSTNMTYARTEADYETHRAEFKNLSLREGRQELWDYFEKNWNAEKKMWVMAYRIDLPHFKNHTNNRVESLFSKVKQHVKGHLTMHSSLKALLTFQLRKEEEYYAKVEMPGTLSVV